MFKYFMKRKKIMIIVCIICVLLAVVYTKFFVVPEYKAVAQFILTNDDLKTEAEVYSYATMPDRYFAITNSRSVVEKVVTNLKLKINNIEKFKNEQINIIHSPNSFLIIVSVVTDDAKMSADIANEIVRVSIEEIKTIYNDEHIQVLDTAVENGKLEDVDVVKNILIFVCVGEIILLAYIFMSYMFFETLREEKTKGLSEKEKINEKYLKNEKELIENVKNIKEYSNLMKEKKRLEKDITKETYKKVSKINEDVIDLYMKEAYFEGYIEAKKSNEKSVEE